MSDQLVPPSTSPDVPAHGGDAPSAARKTYEAPKLVEYGDIAALTQTAGVTTTDGKGTRKQRVG